jgi:hypothetical protein
VLGYAGFFTLVDDNGWTYHQAEKWLCTAVSQALLKRSSVSSGNARRASTSSGVDHAVRKAFRSDQLCRLVPRAP